MRIIESARKHGITDIDIVYVFSTANVMLETTDEPPLTMLLGYDTLGRGLEVGYIIDDYNEEIIIHAMKIRNIYKPYLLGTGEM